MDLFGLSQVFLERTINLQELKSPECSYAFYRLSRVIGVIPVARDDEGEMKCAIINSSPSCSIIFIYVLCQVLILYLQVLTPSLSVLVS